MLKYIQLFLKVSLLLIIAVVITIILTMVFFDPNAYKADINHLVNKYTGRELTINGKIKWALTPQITLCIQDITLSNISSFSGQFLKATEANIKLGLIELLKKKIVIKGLNIQNPELYLGKAKNGQTNFDDLIAPKQQNTVAVQNTQITQHTLAKTTKIKGQPSPITIDELSIKNGKIQWQDNTSNKNILLQNLNISSKNLKLDSANALAPILISGNIKDLNNNFKEIAFAATLSGNLATKTFKLEPSQIKMAKINAFGNLLIKASNNVITINPINIDVLDSKHQASVVIDLKEKTPILSITEQTNIFPIEKILTELAQFKKLHGNTKITAVVKAKGMEPSALKNSLQGTIDIAIQQGAFYGVDLHKLLKQAESTLHGLFSAIKEKEHASIPALLSSQVKDWKTSQQDANAKTNFDALHAEATFQNGISKDVNFTVQHSDYDVNGYGEINLITETVNMQFKATYKGANQSKDSTVANYMLQTPVPILVQGSIYNPTIKPDLHTYCKEALGKVHKEVLKDVIKKSLNKIISKTVNNKDDTSSNPLKNLEKNLLDNLFNKRKD